jgi:anaerobic ribonucleoside-triphosphate reductase
MVFGLEIISHMASVCERLAQRHHISFVLSGFPNQAVSSRLARLDLRYYSPDSGYVVKGDLGSGKVYYTDAIAMNPDKKYPLLKRMNLEGKFSRYMPGGTVSCVPVEGNFAHKKEIVDFITSVFRDTQNVHIYFTSETSSPRIFL